MKNIYLVTPDNRVKQLCSPIHTEKGQLAVAESAIEAQKLVIEYRAGLRRASTVYNVGRYPIKDCISR